MNRGNLAEDPRVDRPSYSRYSRYEGEKNSLLYVSDREWRKASSGKKEKDGKVKSRHTRVSAGTASGYSSLEVGRHGRLFGVKVSPSSRAVPSGKKVSSAAAIVQEAGQTESRQGEHAGNEALAQDLRISSASQVFTTKKPARPYLDAPNPLLEKKNIRPRAEKKADAGRKSLRTKAAAPELRGEAIPAEGAAAAAMSAGIPAPADPGMPSKVTAAAAMSAGIPAPADPGMPSKVTVTAALPAASAQKAESRSMSGRKMLAAAAAGVAAALYIAAGVHYDDHFYPGTEFFGIDADGMTVGQVKRLVAEKVGTYSLKLEGRAGSENSHGLNDTITAQQIGLKYRDNGMIDAEMKSQYSALWPVMMVKSLVTKNHETLGTEYDAEKADAVLSNLSIFDKSLVTAPKNAELKFNDDGAYISGEVMGTTLDEEKTRQAVIQALNDGSTYIDLDKEGLYQNPTVYSDDNSLKEKTGALNKVLGADITLDFGDRSEVLDPETIADRFLSLDMDGNYYVDPDKLNSYVEDLAGRFDTVGDAREFSTSLGTTVRLEGGDYGWSLDAESTEQELLAAIEQKKKGELEPVYFQTGYCRDADDIGDTYVEIDLTNQRMWFYKNGSLIVDTPVVTGNPLKNNETPSGGVWSLKGKYRNAILKGQGYATPVDYWMPFNGGVGIHDLQARYYFGGSIYMGAGSHGCVNTPLAAVKLIYQNIESGTPVVVYKDESDAAVSQNMGMQDIGTITANIEANFGTVSDDDQTADGGAAQTFETDQNAASSGQEGGSAQ